MAGVTVPEPDLEALSVDGAHLSRTQCLVGVITGERGCI